MVTNTKKICWAVILIHWAKFRDARHCGTNDISTQKTSSMFYTGIIKPHVWRAKSFQSFIPT